MTTKQLTSYIYRVHFKVFVDVDILSETQHEASDIASNLQLADPQLKYDSKVSGAGKAVCRLDRGELINSVNLISWYVLYEPSEGVSLKVYQCQAPDKDAAQECFLHNYAQFSSKHIHAIIKEEAS